MDQAVVSKLKFYSLGLVAKNKPLSSKTIEVTPIENFPMINGEVTDNIDKYKAKSVDASGSVKNVEVETTITIKATWLPINNSNRKTAPDLRRGETVVLYQFADSDKYWWNTLFDDNVLRRLETAVYAFSNNSKENIQDDSDSTYYLEVSTHRKLMHVHTSKNDGEPFAYDIQIDAKNGAVTITDDVGNFFVLNSKDRRLTMSNADGSVVDINKKVIDLTSTDAINLSTKVLSMKAEKIIGAGGSSVNISGGSSVTISSPTTSVD